MVNPSSVQAVVIFRLSVACCPSLSTMAWHSSPFWHLLFLQTCCFHTLFARPVSDYRRIYKCTKSNYVVMLRVLTTAWLPEKWSRTSTTRYIKMREAQSEELSFCFTKMGKNALVRKASSSERLILLLFSFRITQRSVRWANSRGEGLKPALIPSQVRLSKTNLRRSKFPCLFNR